MSCNILQNVYENHFWSKIIQKAFHPHRNGVLMSTRKAICFRSLLLNCLDITQVNIKMWNVNYCKENINILSYVVVFIKKINLLRLLNWCFPGKFMNFSEAGTGGVSQAEYCKIFKNTNFKEHLTAASEFLKQLQNSGEQLRLHLFTV